MFRCPSNREVILVSSQAIKSTLVSTSANLDDISRRLPIGEATRNRRPDIVISGAEGSGEGEFSGSLGQIRRVSCIPSWRDGSEAFWSPLERL